MSIMLHVHIRRDHWTHPGTHRMLFLFFLFDSFRGNTGTNLLHEAHHNGESQVFSGGCGDMMHSETRAISLVHLTVCLSAPPGRLQE